MSTAAAKEELKFEEVESSHVHSRAFDKERGVIVVRFEDGRQYEYPDCDDQTWKRAKAAKSFGSFIHKELNMKAYKKLDDWK